MKRKWEAVPARKPSYLAVYAFAALIIVKHDFQGTDISPGILGLLQTMVYSVTMMYGLTSSGEAIYGGGFGGMGFGSGGMLPANQPPYYFGQNGQGGIVNDGELPGQ